MKISIFTIPDCCEQHGFFISNYILTTFISSGPGDSQQLINQKALVGFLPVQLSSLLVGFPASWGSSVGCFLLLNGPVMAGIECRLLPPNMRWQLLLPPLSLLSLLLPLFLSLSYFCSFSCSSPLSLSFISSKIILWKTCMGWCKTFGIKMFGTCLAFSKTFLKNK